MKENLIDMILERASHYGSRDVFRYRDAKSKTYKSISWDNFISNSGKVSRALISSGVEPLENVGIFSDNCPEWTITDIGIVGIRSVVVPFYSTSSKQQLKYIVDETCMKLIFVGGLEQYEKALWLLDNTETLKKIVVFDPDIVPDNDSCIGWQTFINLDSGNNLELELKQRIMEIKNDDLVTIIYTSGTTGEPKGVMLTHSTFLYCFKIHDKRLVMTDKYVSACFLPLSHVFERAWTYYVLHKGAVNVYIDNPKDVVNRLPSIKPDVMCAVPRFFEKTYEGIQVEYAKWPSVKKKIFDWSIDTGQKRSEYQGKTQYPPLGLRIKYKVAEILVLKKLQNILGGKIKFMPCAGAAISTSLLRFFHAAGIFIDYGYGATETSATVSCFEFNRYDYDTCGTIMPDIEVKISDGGEILVKGGSVFTGYYKKPEVTAKTLIDGWYHTGDKGCITPNNDLVMTDRIKDMMKTSSGKYVSPQRIELELGKDPFIEQVIAIGDKRKYVTALIVPSFATLKREVERMGLKVKDNAELVLTKEILEFYNERIARIQDDFAPHERVVKFKLIPEAFSIQNGMLTNSLKIRRNMLIELFKDDIDKMY